MRWRLGPRRATGEGPSASRTSARSIVRPESVAYASLSGRAIDLALVREALGPSPVARRGPSLQRIIAEVCQHYRLSRDDLSGPRRTARLAVPRQLAMYLCRQHTDVPLGKIGAELGGRDHSTVVHALGAIERRLERDATLREAASVLRARLRA